jgi:hypothetical protein
MSPIEKLKAEAIALRASQRALGHPMKHCAALEQVAKKHGYDNWRACAAMLADPASPGTKPGTNIPEMKHYESAEWNFALDIPTRWNAFPAVPSNSPYEVIRFASHEGGTHLLIVFQMPLDPGRPLQEVSEMAQMTLAAAGFGNFSSAETAIGSRAARTLDFDRPKGEGTWSCRHYFVAEGTLGYTLGFGTSNRAGMFEMFDVMAKSFEILGDSPPPSPGLSPL